ncbi:MAG: LLM class flavin-dependent oxidoreductase, partial [Acidimicrobiales bacterium]|nr:LLM class flavin-dependent oxidoreductase [Acidimicrobiales bacterium]
MVQGSVNLIPEAPVSVIRELAVRAEELGYRRCWVYDEGLATRDVYVTLAAILQATSRLIVGPGVTNAYTRHPGQSAAAIATLAEMSGGRA